MLASTQVLSGQRWPRLNSGTHKPLGCSSIRHDNGNLRYHHLTVHSSQVSTLDASLRAFTSALQTKAAPCSTLTLYCSKIWHDVPIKFNQFSSQLNVATTHMWTDSHAAYTMDPSRTSHWKVPINNSPNMCVGKFQARQLQMIEIDINGSTPGAPVAPVLKSSRRSQLSSRSIYTRRLVSLQQHSSQPGRQNLQLCLTIPFTLTGDQL